MHIQEATVSRGYVMLLTLIGMKINVLALARNEEQNHLTVTKLNCYVRPHEKFNPERLAQQS